MCSKKAHRGSVAKTYADSFTINGLTKVATGKRWERILWLVVLFIALSIVSHQTLRFISEYKEYNVRTQVQVVEDHKQIMSDLVVCQHDFLANNTGFCRNGKPTWPHDEYMKSCPKDPLAEAAQEIGFRKSVVFEKFINYPNKCMRIQNLSVSNNIKIYNTRSNDTTARIHIFALDENSTRLSVGNAITSLEPGSYDINFFDHKVYTRLQAPYRSNCSNGENMDVVFPGGYSQSKCEESFHFRQMLANCGTVIDPWLTYAKPSHPRRNNTHMTSKDIDKCLNDNRACKGINGELISCPCPKACHEESYRIKEIVIGADVDWLLNVQAPEIMGESRTTYIEEVPAYTLDKVLADVGGYLSLFVGMSICSLIEIVVYVVTSIKERHFGL